MADEDDGVPDEVGEYEDENEYEDDEDVDIRSDLQWLYDLANSPIDWLDNTPKTAEEFAAYERSREKRLSRNWALGLPIGFLSAAYLYWGGRLAPPDRFEPPADDLGESIGFFDVLGGMAIVFLFLFWLLNAWVYLSIVRNSSSG